MKRTLVLLAVVLTVLCLVGCARMVDNKAFGKAKQANSEKAYRQYLSEHPDGQHVSEAKQLYEQAVRRRDDKEFAQAKASNTIESYHNYLFAWSDGTHRQEASDAKLKLVKDKYRELTQLAFDYESKLLWEDALGTWHEADKLLAHEQAHNHIERCEHKLDNPVELIDITAKFQYSYTVSEKGISDKHYTKIIVAGNLCNNMRVPVRDVVLTVDAYEEDLSILPPILLGEEDPKQTHIKLFKQTLFHSEPIPPGKTRPFSFSTPVSMRRPYRTLSHFVHTADIESYHEVK